MKTTIKTICILTLSLLFSGQAVEVTERIAPPKEPSSDAVSVVYDFDESDNGTDSDTEVSYYSGIERIFKNPALASGLASGAAALNRSITSLMEAIFYSMLDNELIYQASSTTNFGVALKRDLFNTATGSYVIVDRFSVGPRYLQKIAKIGKLPLSIAADTNVNVYNIYPRSDAQRVAESNDLPFWRVALNNWLGLLPLLTRILPPSFNPTELYDPLTQGSAPFIFPVESKLFYEMPVGSIRSYSLSGSVSLPIDLEPYLSKKTRDELRRIESIGANLPVSVFLTGEHRINVLRRSENTAWVGFNTIKRAGVGVSAKIGKLLRVLTKVSPLWAGVDVPFFPVDLDVSKAKAMRFNQLYEFDLRKLEAREAYKAAVNGDFTEAYKRWLDYSEKDIDTGVLFHFKRNEDTIETDGAGSFNLFVYRKSRNLSRSTGEVEITDPDGKIYVLESRQEVDDENWNVIVGGEDRAIKDNVELKVKKVFDKDDKDKYTYVFSASDKNPIFISMSMYIKDRHVDAEELEDYVSDLRRFTKLPLRSLPTIKVRDPRAVQNRQRRIAFASPSSEHQMLHVPPTYLGRFNATAAINISTEVLDGILEKSEEDMWRAFADAFEVDYADIEKTNRESSLNVAIQTIRSLLAFPLRAINFRSPSWDFYWHTRWSIEALQKIKAAKEPQEKLSYFDDLLATAYPDKLTTALLNLSELGRVPRSVTFFTNSKGYANKKTKNNYRSLNNQVIRSQIGKPAAERHRIAEDKLAAFFPSQLKERRIRPVITNIKVESRDVPKAAFIGAQLPDGEQVSTFTLESAFSGPSKRKQIVLTLKAKNMRLGQDGRFYLRIQDAGEVQVGQFVSAEQVVAIPPLQDSIFEENGDFTESTYEIWLTGPLSPLTTFMLGESMDLSGNLQVNVAASTDGKVWSSERTLTFKFEDGRLTPF